MVYFLLGFKYWKSFMTIQAFLGNKSVNTVKIYHATWLLLLIFNLKHYFEQNKGGLGL